MSPVIATILMVAITVVLAAVLYVMVSGLICGPRPPPTAIGVNLERSPNGTNWTLTVTSAPSGKALTRKTLMLKGAGGDVALASAPLSTYLPRSTV